MSKLLRRPIAGRELPVLLRLPALSDSAPELEEDAPLHVVRAEEEEAAADVAREAVEVDAVVSNSDESPHSSAASSKSRPFWNSAATLSVVGVGLLIASVLTYRFVFPPSVATPEEELDLPAVVVEAPTELPTVELPEGAPALAGPTSPRETNIVRARPAEGPQPIASSGSGAQSTAVARYPDAVPEADSETGRERAPAAAEDWDAARRVEEASASPWPARGQDSPRAADNAEVSVHRVPGSGSSPAAGPTIQDPGPWPPFESGSAGMQAAPPGMVANPHFQADNSAGPPPAGGSRFESSPGPGPGVDLNGDGRVGFDPGGEIPPYQHTDPGTYWYRTESGGGMHASAAETSRSEDMRSAARPTPGGSIAWPDSSGGSFDR